MATGSIIIGFYGGWVHDFLYEQHFPLPHPMATELASVGFCIDSVPYEFLFDVVTRLVVSLLWYLFSESTMSIP
jgi:hypothetical protein